MLVLVAVVVAVVIVLAIAISERFMISVPAAALQWKRKKLEATHSGNVW